MNNLCLISKQWRVISAHNCMELADVCPFDPLFILWLIFPKFVSLSSGLRVSGGGIIHLEQNTVALLCKVVEPQLGGQSNPSHTLLWTYTQTLYSVAAHLWHMGSACWELRLCVWYICDHVSQMIQLYIKQDSWCFLVFSCVLATQIAYWVHMTHRSRLGVSQTCTCWSCCANMGKLKLITL